MKLKILSFIMLFWTIFGITVSSYFIYDLWFLSYDLVTKNISNFLGAITITLMLVTLIIVLFILISDLLEDLK